MQDSTIPPEIYHTIQEGTYGPGGYNWIAQHPPLYYLPTAAIWKISAFFTEDIELRFRTCRLVAGLSGTFTLWFLFLVIKEMTSDFRTAFAAMTFVAFIPMFSFLSSGVNHDTTVTMLCSLSILYAIRFGLRRQYKDSIISALAIACAASTKITALVLIPPLITTFFLLVDAPFRKKTVITILLAALACSLPGLWLLRSIILYGGPFVYAGDFLSEIQEPLDVSFLEYMREHPVVRHLHIHFYGLFGWLTTGVIQLSGPSMRFFDFATLFFAFSSCFWLIQQQLPESPYFPSTTKKKLLLLGLLWAIPLTSLFWNPALLQESFLVRAAYSFLIGAFVAAGFSFFMKPTLRQQIVNLCLLTSLFYVIIAFTKLYGIYVNEHRFGAIHGRYFFAILPLLLVGSYYPAFKLLKKHSFPLLLLSISAGAAELYANLYHLFPAYQLP